MAKLSILVIAILGLLVVRETSAGILDWMPSPFQNLLPLLLGSKETGLFHDEKGRTALVHYKGKNIVFCELYGENNEAMNEALREKLRKSKVEFAEKVVSDEFMGDVLDRCTKLMQDNLFPFGWIKAFSPEAIFPGTKWCGRGNIAKNYDDLGPFAATDSCCRTHDQCPEGIAVGETFKNLTNNGAGTMSACHCDETFRQCLKDSKTAASEVVAHMFFNLIGMQCFKEEYPIIKCREYSSPLSDNPAYAMLFPSTWYRQTLGRQCKVYDLNTTQEKQAQIFDEDNHLIDMKIILGSLLPGK